MKSDPVIDEIRDVRRKISAEYGHDPRRLMAHYIEYEKQLERDGRFRLAKREPIEAAQSALNDKPIND